MQSIPKYWKTQLKQENGLIPFKLKMIDIFLQVKQTNKFAHKLLTLSKNNELKTNHNKNGMIIKRLDPLSAKKTFIRKKLGHTMVLAIKASSVTL